MIPKISLSVSNTGTCRIDAKNTAYSQIIPPVVPVSTTTLSQILPFLNLCQQHPTQSNTGSCQTPANNTPRSKIQALVKHVPTILLSVKYRLLSNRSQQMPTTPPSVKYMPLSNPCQQHRSQSNAGPLSIPSQQHRSLSNTGRPLSNQYQLPYSLSSIDSCKTRPNITAPSQIQAFVKPVPTTPLPVQYRPLSNPCQQHRTQ